MEILILWCRLCDFATKNADKPFKIMWDGKLSFFQVSLAGASYSMCQLFIKKTQTTGAVKHTVHILLSLK